MALASDRRYTTQSPNGPLTLPVAAGVILYSGALCVTENNVVIPVKEAAGLNYVGVNTETVDNRNGADAAQNCQLDRNIVGCQLEEGEAAMVPGNIGKPLYGVDDETVSLDGTGRSQLGTLSHYASTGAGNAPGQPTVFMKPLQ